MADLTRRRFFLGVMASFGAGAAAAMLGERIWARFAGPSLPFRDVVQDVVPRSGFQTSLRFGDTIQRLIEAGVLNPARFRAVYQARGGLRPWVEQALTAPSDEPIVLSFETAPYLLNLLWPIGLATRASFNDKSPINNSRLPFYASTAGWTLGNETNGARYFNSVSTLSMTADQEQAALEVAQNTFRPCCDNPTYFQDCNHGSALLGLIELAASQGATKTELYKVALMANSFWFPSEYIKTALYLMLYERRTWKEMRSQDIMGPRFSSASGWLRNVNVPVQLANFIPRSALLQMNQGACRI